MPNKDLSQLEGLVQNKHRHNSGHLHYMLLFGTVATASLLGAMESGFCLATEKKVGFVMPALSTIIPLAAGYIGYELNHLSAKGDPLSRDYKIPNKLSNGAKYFSIGLAIQAISFGVGYSLGCFL